MAVPEKIILLGGGLGSLCTAYYLTSKPGWQEKYDLTLYQMGFRLGGKGASGRNLEESQRIEEHGLHIWFGFYDNAFRLMRQVFAELDRPLSQPLATVEEAFKPANFFVLEEKVGEKWTPWPVWVPMNDLKPGLDFQKWTAHDYVRFLLEMTHDNYRSLSQSKVESIGLDLEGRLLRDAAELLDRIVDKGHLKIVQNVRRFLDRLARKMEARIDKDETARRLWILVELALVNAVGILEDDLFQRGFESIDGWDYREWLKHHGASELTVRSAPVQAIYGLVFCGRDYYTFAAGTALKGTLRFLFDFKGAIAWRMQAGMGDTIMTPLYEVLQKRGVPIKFFHKVEDLLVGEKDQKSFIKGIRMGRQVTLKNGSYRPLVDVRGLSCWPSEPLYDQIVEGEELKRLGVDLEDYWSAWKNNEEFTLEVGKDFDRVVLGLSIGSFPYVAKELSSTSEAWKTMVEKIQTTMTAALQLWTHPDDAGVGWAFWKESAVIQGTFIPPFDTWADMSHLLNREVWTGAESPNQVAYLCGAELDPPFLPPLSDHEFPQRLLKQTRQKAVDFLNSDWGWLWPKARDPKDATRFGWNLLVDPMNRTGVDRIESQFVRINVQPTERYVLSAKGTTQYRLAERGSIFTNLVLTGDWIANQVLNAGCVESTVASGLQAANSILADYPTLGSPEEILGA